MIKGIILFHLCLLCKMTFVYLILFKAGAEIVDKNGNLYKLAQTEIRPKINGKTM